MPPRKSTAAMHAVRRLLGDVYAYDPATPDLQTLASRYGDTLPLDHQTLACWRQEDDWDRQRRAVRDAGQPDADTERLIKQVDFLRSLSAKAGSGMRQCRPRSYEQLMQIQLKCAELTFALEAKLDEHRGAQVGDQADEEQAAQDKRTAALSPQDQARIARIVLSAGLGEDEDEDTSDQDDHAADT